MMNLIKTLKEIIEKDVFMALNNLNPDIDREYKYSYEYYKDKDYLDSYNINNASLEGKDGI